MADMKETVGQRVRRLREERGLTQEELAEKSGVSLRIIAGIELGRIRVFGDFLVPIAEALDVKPEYLRIGGDESKADPPNRLYQYAERRFKNSVVREAFKSFVNSNASFREKDWSDTDLAAVEEAFLRLNEWCCEMECFHLPKDDDGQI